jgi:hypothetical protein
MKQHPSSSAGVPGGGLNDPAVLQTLAAALSRMLLAPSSSGVGDYEDNGENEEDDDDDDIIPQIF